MTLTSVNNIETPELSNQFLYEPNQYLVIELADELTKGETYELTIKFSGPLLEDLIGYYLSSYTKDDEKR